MNNHDDPFHRFEHFLVRLTLLILLLLGLVRVLWPEVKSVYTSLSRAAPAHTSATPR